MKEVERTDVALAEAAMLKALCFSLILAHTHPRLVKENFEVSSEMILARLTPTEASEEMLDAALKMKADFLKVLSDRERFLASSRTAQ